MNGGGNNVGIAGLGKFGGGLGKLVTCCINRW